jgi:hypothetical protein
MFLVCAVTIADRQARGVGSLPLSHLGEMLEAAAPGSNALSPADDLIEQHRRTRAGTLGRMADALREAACDMLSSDADFFRPYFSPLRGRGDGGDEALIRAYAAWVDRMRGNEEGDELVILCLSRLLGFAVQPVQQSGYRVPLMDPTGAADKEGEVTFWGNDDRHWVWLRKLSDAPATEAEATPAPPGAASISSKGSGSGSAEPGAHAEVYPTDPPTASDAALALLFVKEEEARPLPPSGSTASDSALARVLAEEARPLPPSESTASDSFLARVLAEELTASGGRPVDPKYPVGLF